MPAGFLYISSKDRMFNSNQNSFEVQVNASDAFNFEQNMLTVDSIIFTNLCYPVNSTNNTIKFFEDAALRTITLTEGYYTSSTFLTELTTQVNASTTSTYSFAISSSTGKLTISRTAGANQFYIASCTALPILGFSGSDSLTNGPATGSYPVNLSGSNFVDFTMNFESHNCKTGRNFGDIFARVPLDKPFGSIITWKNDNTDDIQIPGNLRTIRIEMFDQWENPFNMPYNAYVSIVLKLKTPDY